MVCVVGVGANLKPADLFLMQLSPPVPGKCQPVQISLWFPLFGADHETQGCFQGKNERVVFWSSLGGIKERKGKKEKGKANEKEGGNP